MSDSFLCPICKSSLIKGESFIGIDILNKEFSDVKFKCQNHPGVFWSFDGDFYVEKSCSLRSYDGMFIGNLKSAFGSYSRQLEVEIYKHDEDWTIYEGKNWKFVMTYKYKSNFNGDILSRKRKIQISKKDHEFGQWILYISGIRMLIFLIKSFHKELKNYKNYDNEYFLKSNFKLSEREKKDWWRVFAYKYKMIYIKFFEKKILQKLKDLNSKSCEVLYKFY